MGKKEKSKANAREHEQVGEATDNLDGASTPSLVFSSDDDDDEANQDLSLRIVEKALRAREAKLATNDAVLNGVDSSLVSPSQQSEFKVMQSDGVLDGSSGITAWEMMEEKKTTKLMVDSGFSSVIVAADQEVEEIIKTTENRESVDLEASSGQIGDNVVLRKLLRGPRYFDPPDSSWGACYNCGEEGHAAVNCTEAKRMKPCYVCGGLGHVAKQCTKTNCYICKKGGHRAKDCPEKHMSARVPKSLTVCLKCGNSGHDMFSCRNDYSPDDLKEIQCYLCKTFGHLCCVNTADAILGEISCYKCGQMGHTGLINKSVPISKTSSSTTY
ncbi:cold shock protein 1 isoform X2 [Lathyrus oleraceus]|uniref:cold shock protein 1 isoform X2 n=3 Tax=Pisum sativum TaxID=3888 RepID=UPI0021D0B79B|nr:cold shock protein 1-like isoform X2 [Pisum sativum]XP_050900702.1 cold shock protein 1-like isoform X1 [Pisum sativum]XP_050903068.1 cold shock protein 1-like isoform X1 [Pisum sativum]XP_050903287.1 cold shock protein 1-like isoform X1 [Pisum sativum]XP_050907622.1 cold shock protein 1-like isoform X2 [Pisum sativum]